MQTTPQTPTIETYIDELIREAHPTPLIPEVCEKMKKELYDKLDQFIKVKLLNSLPPEELARFEKLIDKKGSETKVQEFINKKLYDATLFLSQTLLEFRNVYLGIT